MIIAGSFSVNTSGTGLWAVLPKRWVVERTFSWLGNFRRLSKDFEILPGTAENMIRIAMMKITLAKCV
jgi:putative transposase